MGLLRYISKSFIKRIFCARNNDDILLDRSRFLFPYLIIRWTTEPENFPVVINTLLLIKYINCLWKFFRGPNAYRRIKSKRYFSYNTIDHVVLRPNCPYNNTKSWATEFYSNPRSSFCSYRLSNYIHSKNLIYRFMDCQLLFIIVQTKWRPQISNRNSGDQHGELF